MKKLISNEDVLSLSPNMAPENCKDNKNSRVEKSTEFDEYFKKKKAFETFFK
ncbi:MAG: hypothetical protein GF311_14960 [Candidatus Lokiarchaeota archaeon]|nr:hypothetical protein [Candidatus Lokiarchaeota archaeon]